MEHFKNINVPLALFILLTLRSLYAFDFPQAVAFVCVTAIYGYHIHLQSKKVKDLDKEVADELEKMKTVITSLSMKNGLRNPVQQNTEKKTYF